MESVAQLQTNEYWWRAKEGAPVHTRLIPYATWLRGVYRSAHQYDQIHRRIYENPRLRAYQAALERLRGHGFGAAKLNVTKSVVDTTGARLSKRKPMPAFSINDAGWALKRRARQYRKWLVGKMQETEFDQLSPMALRDGQIIGTGLTKIAAGDDDVCAERVLRDEIFVDPRESRYGKPWQMVQIKRYARDWLLDTLDKKFRNAIINAPSSTRQPWESTDDDEMSIRADLSGYVDVYEAWRRPSCDDAEDGRHSMAIDGATFINELWERPRFPVAKFVWCRPHEGYWGRGLVQDLADIQHRINSIVRDIQANIEVGGKLIVAVNEAQDIPVEQLTGSAPFKLKYRGARPPEFTVPNAVSPAAIQLLQFFISQAYELPGSNQAQSASRSPLGASPSGAALDTMYDIESERFATEEENYEAYRMEAAQCYLDAAQDVAKAREKNKGAKRSYIAVWRDGDSIERLELGKVKLDDDQYTLTIEPVNFVPDTRAGKLAIVDRLVTAGVIPKWMAGALFDEPDIARANKVALAPYHNIERIMDQLADVDVDISLLWPEPYHDLNLALEMGKAYYNMMQAEGAPEEILDRYRQWVDAVTNMPQMQPPEPAPPMPPGPLMPPGAGAPNLPPGVMPTIPIAPPGNGAPMPAMPQ